MKNEDLAQKIQAGERDKLPLLWNAVQAFVVRQASRRLDAYRINHRDCAADLEDLVQEGFLAVVKAAESYRGGGQMTFIGWLDLHLKTAFNEALGVQRAKRANDPVHWAESLLQPFGENDGTLMDVLEAADTGMEAIESAIWKGQLCGAVREYMGRLPQEYQRILKWRYWQGMTVQQIAAAEGISKQAVSEKAGNALRKLRKQDSDGRLREFAYQQ